jgi:Protein of unknown function (DUF3140)
VAGEDRDQTVEKFGAAVNMTAGQLERWLDSDESRSVGQKDGGGESTGHRSGRRIVRLLRTPKGDYTDDDLAHMREVAGYVKRHLAQRPDGDVRDTRGGGR